MTSTVPARLAFPEHVDCEDILALMQPDWLVSFGHSGCQASALSFLSPRTVIEISCIDLPIRLP